MESSTGFTVNNSVPFGVPDRSIPNVYTLPFGDILLGVALERVATPPLMEKAKSLASNAPLPPVALYTASEKVTAKVELFAAKDTDVMIGRMSSFNVAVLLLWDVLASLPAAS